jgi:hypothetical protein
MHKASIDYRSTDRFFLVVQRLQGYNSDAIPLSREKAEWLLECVESALDKKFDGWSLSGGDFCRFVELGLNSHFLLSLNLSDVLYKGYDLSIVQLKLLKASLKNALNKADTEIEEAGG